MAGRLLRDLRRPRLATGPSSLLARSLAALTLAAAPTVAGAAPTGPSPREDAAPRAAADEADTDAGAETETDSDSGAVDTETPRPPRLDGPYVGGIVFTGLGLTRVNGFDAGPFAAFGAKFRFGEMVLPWLGLGLALGGSGGTGSGDARQTLGQGSLLVDAVLVPLAKRHVPLSFRVSFGFGAGAVTEEGRDGRSGFGGAAFGGSVAYTFFPWVKKKRPYRGGGFGLGPELGWLGFPPTVPGRPMSNTIVLGLTSTFYFGS